MECSFLFWRDSEKILKINIIWRLKRAFSFVINGISIYQSFDIPYYTICKANRDENAVNIDLQTLWSIRIGLSGLAKHK